MSELLTKNKSSIEKKNKWISWIPLSLRGLLAAVAVVWAIEIIDLILNGKLDQFGVQPRTLSGLIGIPLMPLLHGDFTHLLSNTFPFLILGWIVLKAEKNQFLIATAVITILCGAGTWLIGRNDGATTHIGASGLIYGYFGYVMARACLERNLKWIITGLFVGVFYGSLIFGVIPDMQQKISWEGHLCGMLAGIWFGWRRTKNNKAIEKKSNNPFENSGKLDDEFLSDL